jgi:hypothetical protein
MGIISSRHPLHMLEVSTATAHLMDHELLEIDRELTSMFRQYLTVRGL